MMSSNTLVMILVIVVMVADASTMIEAEVKGIEKKRLTSMDVLHGRCSEGMITCVFAVVRFMSSPIALDKSLPMYVQQIPSLYKVSARLFSIPMAQPYGETLHELSFVLKDDHVTEELSAAVGKCMDEATGGAGRRWGLFNVNQFSNGLFQLEYFVFAQDKAGRLFHSDVEQFMMKKELMRCVRERVPSMSTNAKIIYARRLTPSLPSGLHIRTGSSWWTKYVIAFLLLLNVVGVRMAIGMRQLRLSIVRRRSTKIST